MPGGNAGGGEGGGCPGGHGVVLRPPEASGHDGDVDEHLHRPDVGRGRGRRGDKVELHVLARVDVGHRLDKVGELCVVRALLDGDVLGRVDFGQVEEEGVLGAGGDGAGRVGQGARVHTEEARGLGRRQVAGVHLVRPVLDPHVGAENEAL